MADTKAKYANLAAALVAFQSEIPTPTKDSSADTGKYSYDYASLDKLTPLIFTALSNVGLAYTAVPNVRESDGIFVLRAALVHESGEKIEGDYPLGSPNNPAQAIGSAITYARRYALLSLTGVAPAGLDDDGASASAAQAQAPAQAAAKAQTKAKPVDVARSELSAVLNANTDVIEGADANAILLRLSGSDDPGKWTADHFVKGKAELEALVAERKAAK